MKKSSKVKFKLVEKEGCTSVVSDESVYYAFKSSNALEGVVYTYDITKKNGNKK